MPLNEVLAQPAQNSPLVNAQPGKLPRVGGWASLRLQLAQKRALKKFEHFMDGFIQLRQRFEGNPALAGLTILGLFGDGKLLYKRAGTGYLDRLLRSEFGANA